MDVWCVADRIGNEFMYRKKFRINEEENKIEYIENILRWLGLMLGRKNNDEITKGINKIKNRGKGESKKDRSYAGKI